MTSSQKVTLGFGTAFAILLAVGLAAILQTYQWENSAQVVSHTWEVIGKLNEMAFSARDAENAARRVAVRFTAADALQCRVGLRKVADAADALQVLVRDNPPQDRLLNVLRIQTLRQAAAFEPYLDAETAPRLPAALDEYERERVSARIAGQLQDMESRERQLLAFRTEAQHRVASETRYLFELAAILSLILVVFAVLRSGRDAEKRQAAERALSLREQQYRQVVEMAGDIIYRADRAGRFTFCNQTALATLHLTGAEVMGRSFLRLIRTDYRKKAQRFYLRQAARKEKNTYYEFPMIDGHGQQRWIGQNVQLIMEGDRVAGFQGIAREITARKHAETELQESRAFVERIAATTPGILYVYDLLEKRNVYSNREVQSTLGYDPADFRDDQGRVDAHFHPDDLPSIRSHYEGLRKAQDGEVRRLQYRARHADGHWVWLAARDTPFLRDSDGHVTQIVGIAQDITSRKAAQDRLAYQANFDALTSLANRHHFRSRLQSVLRRASIEQSTTSLCIFDVDLFKDINDRFGHAAGDEVLEAVGSITRSELRPSDAAGRLGGDEFAFVLPETDWEEAALVANRIRERLGTLAFGMAAGGAPFTVTATFGIAEWHEPMTSKELMEAADRALYRAKSAGRNRVCVDV